MRENLSRAPSIGNLDLHTRKLVFECKIIGNATAASKTFTVDAQDVVIMRLKGLTATADALEAVTWTTATDTTNSVFGILIDGTQLEGAGNIRKVKKVVMTQVVATGSSNTLRTPANTSVVTDMLTAGGNIAIEVLMTGTSLIVGSSVAPTFCIEVYYEVFK